VSECPDRKRLKISGVDKGRVFTKCQVRVNTYVQALTIPEAIRPGFTEREAEVNSDSQMKKIETRKKKFDQNRVLSDERIDAVTYLHCFWERKGCSGLGCT
jgi:hypothetical protein